MRLSEGIAAGTLKEYLDEDGRSFEKIRSQLLSHGYAELDEGLFRLTPQGFLISNEIISYLLSDGFNSSRRNF